MIPVAVSVASLRCGSSPNSGQTVSWAAEPSPAPAWTARAASRPSEALVEIVPSAVLEPDPQAARTATADSARTNSLILARITPPLYPMGPPPHFGG